MINYEPSSGPFAHTRNSSVRIMYTVLLSLLPATIFGIYQFGLGSLRTVLVCCAVAVLAEYASLKLMQRRSAACMDGSALLTGLLLAMSLPSTVPMWLAAMGSAFAIIVGKQIYGGLGQNLFNPAMLARVMLLICFPVEMTNWAVPTPLDFSHNLVTVPDGWLQFDGVTAATTLSGLSKTPESLFSMFLGTEGGSLGETSSLLILAGGLLLLQRRIIHWAIPLSFLAGLGIPSLIGHWFAPTTFLSLPAQIFSGGAMLGAFYIATDLVTSPTSVRGQLVYGAGCGLLIWLIRSFGNYPEGVAFAVLIMNAASPLIDHYLRPAIFGSRSVAGK
ncbi:RnfABCDGE type electron transport complex subunit D [Shewanella yunxiaonensis]|uniref:Ion-translocating oxidoreductase complex subunit D n=1 Tax=Shewanella yunxiaonensis TaxID=2829809 RepID=A0ABX7YUK5_9GAMM|nr:RnfABCDGE type electron transport complex subunit D [Shewanella yunxiaonensis]QUN06387.1 RnfABCDGE type electron transport complex subunit D [Shewanella yunxiaonensis]